MKKYIRFVIIGTGNIASTYVNAVRKIDNAEVVGLISRASNSFAGAKDLKIYHSLKAIPSDQFDAVIICTPNAFHHNASIEAANLGKHVLCEKPIDINLNNVDRMITACKYNNVKLGVAYQRRFSSDNPIIKSLIEKQELGKIFSVDLSVRNYRDDNYYNSAAYRGTYDIDGGGPFIQQASHYIDLYYWYFGRPKKLASALNTYVHDIEVEDHGAVICIHDSGMIGTITASTATKPGFPAKMEIYSDKGYLIMENDAVTQWDMEGLDNPSKNLNTSHTGSSTAKVEDTRNHEYVIKDFIESINKNRDPLISGEEAKVSTEIILDIYKNKLT